MALSMLAGCVSPASIDNLAQARQQYGELAQHCVVGDKMACAALPTAAMWVAQTQSQVEFEQQQGNAIAADILAAGLLGIASAAPYGGYHGYHGNYGFHGYHGYRYR